MTKYFYLSRYITVAFTPAALQMASLKAVLGGLSLSSAEYKSGESQPSLEAFLVFRHVTRIATGVLLITPRLYGFFILSASAVAEVAIIKKCGAQVKHALELYVCAGSKNFTRLTNSLEYVAFRPRHGKIDRLS